MKDYFKERVRCAQCLETGLILITQGSKEILLCCGCKCGDEKARELNIPQWNFEIHKVFRTRNIPEDWFKPSESVTPTQAYEHWQALLKISQEHWRDRCFKGQVSPHSLMPYIKGRS